MKFDANKRGLFHVVRSQAYRIDRQTTQERKETIYAVLAVGSIILATVVFLWLDYVS